MAIPSRFNCPRAVTTPGAAGKMAGACQHHDFRRITVRWSTNSVRVPGIRGSGGVKTSTTTQNRMNNLIDRFNKLTPEQQATFGRMVCAHAMQLETFVGAMPFMRSQADTVGDMCVSFLDGVSSFVPMGIPQEAA